MSLLGDVRIIFVEGAICGAIRRELQSTMYGFSQEVTSFAPVSQSGDGASNTGEHVNGAGKTAGAVALPIPQTKRRPGRPLGARNKVSAPSRAILSKYAHRNTEEICRWALGKPLKRPLKLGGYEWVWPTSEEVLWAKQWVGDRTVPKIQAIEHTGIDGEALTESGSDDEPSLRHTVRSLFAGLSEETRAAADVGDDDETGDGAGLTALRTAAASLVDEDGKEGVAGSEAYGRPTRAESQGPIEPRLHSQEFPEKNSETASGVSSPGARAGGVVTDSGASRLPSYSDVSPRRTLAGGGSFVAPTSGERLPAGWRVVEQIPTEGTQAGQPIINIYDPRDEHRGRAYDADAAVAKAKALARADDAAGVTPVRRAPSDLATAEVGERILVGERGGWLELREIAGDGRERWAVCDANGNFQGVKWGKAAAEAEAERLIGVGKI